MEIFNEMNKANEIPKSGLNFLFDEKNNLTLGFFYFCVALKNLKISMLE